MIRIPASEFPSAHSWAASWRGVTMVISISWFPAQSVHLRLVSCSVMSEPEDIEAGIDAMRKEERLERDAAIAKEVEQTERIADHLATDNDES